jgi:hypothetical protein
VSHSGTVKQKDKKAYRVRGKKLIVSRPYFTLTMRERERERGRGGRERKMHRHDNILNTRVLGREQTTFERFVEMTAYRYNNITT